MDMTNADTAKTARTAPESATTGGGGDNRNREGKVKQPSVFQLLKPYTGGKMWLLGLVAVSSIIYTLLSVLAAFSLWKTILAIIDMRQRAGEAADARWWAAAAVICALLSVIQYIITLSISHKFAFEIEKRIRLQASARALRKPLGFFMANDTGAIRKNVDNNASETHTFVAHQFPDIVSSLALPAFTLILIFWVDWKLALVSMAGFIVAMVLMGFFMSKNNDKVKEYFDAQKNMNAEAVEFVRGMAVVKTFGSDVDTFKNYRKSIRDYSIYVLDYTVSFMMPYVILSTLVGITGFLLAFWASLQIGWFDGDYILTDEFGRRFILFVLITPILNNLMMRIAQVQQGEMTRQCLSSIESMLDFEDFPATGEVCGPIDTIEFDKVGFAYPSRPERKILDGLDLKFERHKSYALVGSSGGGKSTIAALAARFWDVQEGKVLINGKDIRDYNPDTVYDRLTCVLQRSGLLPGTLRDNLLAADPRATDEQMIEAMKEASSMDILEMLPEGLDTPLGGGGTVHLSGGEIQRIGIARAMLKKSDVLILDEATSYADPDNEHKIQQGIGRLAQGRTLIMIAHRLNTVRNVDKILVIEKGRVIEEGSHEELMAIPDGKYRSMQDDFEQSIRWSLSNRDDSKGPDGDSGDREGEGK